MSAEVDDVAGPKGKHDRGRKATRHGSERGSVTLGGRRVGLERPRMRSADRASEVPVATYEHFSSRDPLSERSLRADAGRSLDPQPRPPGRAGRQRGGGRGSAESKSAVSREFVERTTTALVELMARRLDDVRLAVMAGSDHLLTTLLRRTARCIVLLIDTRGASQDQWVADIVSLFWGCRANGPLRRYRG